MQKNSFLCLCYILRAISAGRCRERSYADHIFIQIYVLQNAPFRSKIFQNFLRLWRQGGIDPPNQSPADVPGCCVCRQTEMPRLLSSIVFVQCQFQIFADSYTILVLFSTRDSVCNCCCTFYYLYLIRASGDMISKFHCLSRFYAVLFIFFTLESLYDY